MNINEFKLPIKVYPVSIGLKDMGFYTVIHSTSRYEVQKEDMVQVTLFQNEKPYMHHIEVFESIIDDIKTLNNYYVSENCDRDVFELLKHSEEKNFDTAKNERREDINKLAHKYGEIIKKIDNDSHFYALSLLSESYVEGKIDFDTAEKLFKDILNTI